MELYRESKNTPMCEISVTGNSRLRILNDYEDGFINKCNITYDNQSMKLIAYNPKKLQLIEKCYLTLQYTDKIPYIDCIWKYNDFVPSYVLYPIRDIKQDTLDSFKIKKQIPIDFFEIEKNQRIIDQECDEYEYNMNIFTKKKSSKLEKSKITCPSIISKYGKLIKLQKKNSSNSHKDLELDLEFSDDEIPNDFAIEETIDASVFDDLQ